MQPAGPGRGSCPELRRAEQRGAGRRGEARRLPPCRSPLCAPGSLAQSQKRLQPLAELLKFIPLCILQYPPFFCPLNNKPFAILGKFGWPGAAVLCCAALWCAGRGAAAAGAAGKAQSWGGSRARLWRHLKLEGHFSRSPARCPGRAPRRAGRPHLTCTGWSWVRLRRLRGCKEGASSSTVGFVWFFFGNRWRNIFAWLSLLFHFCGLLHRNINVAL